MHSSKLALLALALGAALAFLAASCQCQAACSSANCSGCCDASGTCLPGNGAAACGLAGNACVTCGTGLNCENGACTANSGGGAGGGLGGGAGGGGGSGGGLSASTCTECTTSADCANGDPCTQYAGSDYCGHPCSTGADCGSGESCLITSSVTGAQVQVCVPTNGTCGTVGCGTCPSGYTCDPLQGACFTGAGGGAGGGSGTDGGTCANYDLPQTPSCCTSCTPGVGNCAANGCFGGWWCDRNACICHAPLSGGCGTGGGAGGGGGGVVSYDGGVGPGGGTVSKLYFAVVGDTRPSLEDDTANYPTAIITKIYQDLAALSPRPQFVITTGDYMFANPYASQGAAQMALYMTARNQFPNVVFSAMGNHECTGGSSTNCDAKITNNLTTFMSNLVSPLGHSVPWYTVPISDSGGQWSAKVIVTACNLWNTTQKDWLATELAKPTTFTFVVRHMPTGSNGPCNAEMDTMLASANLTGLLVGHTHSVYFSGGYKQLTEGVGGAPITGGANYGYALIEQQSNNTFKVTQHDYSSNAVTNTWTLP